jgi:hypothetical protein
MVTREELAAATPEERVNAVRAAHSDRALHVAARAPSRSAVRPRQLVLEVAPASVEPDGLELAAVARRKSAGRAGQLSVPSHPTPDVGRNSWERWDSALSEVLSLGRLVDLQLRRARTSAVSRGPGQLQVLMHAGPGDASRDALSAFVGMCLYALHQDSFACQASFAIPNAATSSHVMMTAW